jgi:hypothetical protein
MLSKVGWSAKGDLPESRSDAKWMDLVSRPMFYTHGKGIGNLSAYKRLCLELAGGNSHEFGAQPPSGEPLLSKVASQSPETVFEDVSYI